MSSPPGVHLVLSDPDRRLCEEASRGLGLSLEGLFQTCALRFAEDHGFRADGGVNLWQRRSPFLGPPPARPERGHPLFIPTPPESAAVLAAAAAYFKFQAPRGGFVEASLADYLLVATLRSLETLRAPGGGWKRAAPAAAAAPPAPAKAAPVSAGAEGKVVLGVAVVATLIVLGVFLARRASVHSQPAATVAPSSVAPVKKAAAPGDGLTDLFIATVEEAGETSPTQAPRRVPLFTPLAASPSRIDANNIDELLESRFGRPKVPARAPPKAKDLPPWLRAPARNKSFDALDDLIQVVPPDQAYDVAISLAIADVAAIHPIPMALVKGIIRRESNFNPKARSKTGAIGLMQVMPFTAERVGLTEEDLWIPEKNILGGVRLLAVLLKYYQGDVISALTAYNARPRKLFAPVPRNGETPEYIAAVLGFYQEYNGKPLRAAAP